MDAAQCTTLQRGVRTRKKYALLLMKNDELTQEPLRRTAPDGRSIPTWPSALDKIIYRFTHRMTGKSVKYDPHRPLDRPGIES